MSETEGRGGVVTGRGANGELALIGFATGLGPMLFGAEGDDEGLVDDAAGTTGRGAKGLVGFDIRAACLTFGSFGQQWLILSSSGKVKACTRGGRGEGVWPKC